MPSVTGIPPNILKRIQKQYPQLPGDWQPICTGLGNVNRGCLLAIGSRRYYLKRYDPRFRSTDAITAEHRLIRYLVAGGFPTPDVLDNANHQTITGLGGNLYTLFEGAPGEDPYRDESVFAPFHRPEHAAGAGKTLALFHRIAERFPDPPRKPFRGLTARYELMGNPDLREGMGHLLDSWPLLRDFIVAQPKLPGLLRILEPYHRQLVHLLSDLPHCMIHGDFIKRNLFYDGDRVVSVIDFDLCNRASRLYDLCLALQPIAFPWDQLLKGKGGVNERDAGSFLESYTQEIPLGPLEIVAFPAVLATCRFEFYLSLIGQELERGNREQARHWFKLQAGVLQWFNAHPQASGFLLARLERPVR